MTAKVRGPGVVVNRHLQIPKAARPALDALSLALLSHSPPCADHPALWWDTHPVAIAAAIEVCCTCQLLVLCGTYAAAANESSGVWAGVDRTVRRRAGSP